MEAEPYEVPAKEWVDAYTAGISEIVPVAGVQEVLQKIQDAGIMQIILSASEENMLHKMLGQLQFNTFLIKFWVHRIYMGVEKLVLLKNLQRNPTSIYPALCSLETQIMTRQRLKYWAATAFYTAVGIWQPISLCLVVFQ